MATRSLLACRQSQESQESDTTQSSSEPSEPSPVPAAAKPKDVSFALFKGEELLVCYDLIAPSPEAVRRFSEPDEEEPKDATFTQLKQDCSSLGRTALTTCATKTSVTRYYLDKYSDKYMKDCIKSGGEWSTNQDPEAELERAKQRLNSL